MLKSLSIKNLAVIEEASVDFHNGLNVLTGETGAGKSIIIDSLNLITGTRASKDIIRTGASSSKVEALFFVDEFQALEIEKIGIECPDSELIISRELNADGKNTIRINGNLATLAMLREIGELLINIHGQNENQTLLKSDNHIEILDSFAKNCDLVEEYKKLYNEAMKISRELKDSRINQEEKERLVSLYKYEIECIEKAELKEGEYEELLEKRRIFSSSEKIVENLKEAYSRLSSGYNGSSVEELLSYARKKITEISGIDEKLSSLSDRINDLYFNLADLNSELNSMYEEYGFDEEEIDRTEERINEINDLRRRFGSDYRSIMNYYNDISEKLNQITFSEDYIKEAEQRLNKIKSDLKNLADKISEGRKEAALKLEKAVLSHLNDLNMKNTRFKIDITEEDKFLNNGINKVEFLMSANAGMELGRMTKIASGGELSRIMLSINCALLDTNRVPTMIYDEIDTGVSGRAAQRISEKLYFVSSNRQVLCVTHLAQIAAMADHHYLIEKKAENNKTKTSVTELDDSARKEELARILGGVSITENTRLSAEEMLELTKEYKTEVRKNEG